MQAILFCEHTHNPSALLVQYGMYLYQKKHDFPFNRVYNHWGLKVNGEVWEAVGKGVVKSDRELKTEHLKFSVNLTDQAWEYLKAQEGKKYEFLNFLFYPLMLIYPKWLGSKTDKRHSCVELVSRTLIKAGYNVPVFSNPVDLQNWGIKRLWQS